MTWLLARVHELAAANILAALPKLRRRDRVGDDDDEPETAPESEAEG